MRKVPLLALGLVALLASPADALELKNARAAYGFLSAPRPNNRFLPGDKLFFFYEIEDLKVSDKTGVAKLQQAMELLDGKGKSIFKQDPVAMEVPLFGFHRMPGFVQTTMTTDQKPGAYALKVTVTDTLAKGAAAKKSLTYDFVLLKPAFGIVQPYTPAVAFVNQDTPFAVRFALTGMARDKNKMPDVEVAMRLLGEDGKPLLPAAITNNLKDLHIEQAFDISKMMVVPMELPLAVTKAGRFTIALEATDRIGREVVRLRLPLTVIDPAPYLKQAGARPSE